VPGGAENDDHDFDIAPSVTVGRFVAMPNLPRRVVMTGAAGSIGRAVRPTLGHVGICTRRTWSPGRQQCWTSPIFRPAVTRSKVLTLWSTSPALQTRTPPGMRWCRPTWWWRPSGRPGPRWTAGCAGWSWPAACRSCRGTHRARQTRTGDAPRPANLYGATKAWSEALGAWVAASSSTSVVALRIGYFAPSPPAGAGATARDLAAWLSPRDGAELLRVAVQAEGITFAIANGLSANRYRAADLSETVQMLGYHPVDDAWSHQESIVNR